jgi:hypothetical protein
MSQWKGESREAWLVRQQAEHRAWRERNRERLRVYQRAYGRKYRAAHYDRLREYHRKWLAGALGRTSLGRIPRPYRHHEL